jgi:diguanylate cyclase (GGDEF)-like protein
MLNKTLEDLAQANRIDGLTQIFNRKHWEECLEKEFSRARRYKHGLALIMFDLDHFKLLNDTYGHLGGDLVLIETAKVITSLLRKGDLFGRYGGEEFAIILPNTDKTGALDVAERIRIAINNNVINFQESNVKVTASVGVAVINENNHRYEDLISNADLALYDAKASGRNIVRVANELIEV